VANQEAALGQREKRGVWEVEGDAPGRDRTKYIFQGGKRASGEVVTGVERVKPATTDRDNRSGWEGSPISCGEGGHIQKRSGFGKKGTGKKKKSCLGPMCNVLYHFKGGSGKKQGQLKNSSGGRNRPPSGEK